MIDEQELRRQAKKIQGELARHAALAVYLDDLGQPRIVPGYRPRLVGIYEQGATVADLADDIRATLDAES